MAMTRRGWIVFGAFVTVDGVDFALTVRDHLDYRAGPGAVTVMPLGQLLGWVTSVAIFLALLAIVITAIRGRLDRARARTWRAAATDQMRNTPPE
jgi:hypothetical protein